MAWPVLLDLAACTIAANVKGQFLLMAGVLAAEIALLELWSRRPPVISALFVLLVGIIAQLAGFRVGDWGPYAKHIIDSFGGYAQSFALAGSAKEALWILLSVLGLLTVDAVTSWRSQQPVESLFRWIALSMLIWIDAKGALTRQDATHVMRTVASVMVFFAVYMLANRGRQTLAVKIGALIPAACLCALFLSHRATLDEDGYRFSPESAIRRSIGQFVRFARHGIGPAQNRDSALRREIASMMPAHLTAGGSVAAFGTYQSLVLAHAGPVATLPIIAPYEIWTPWTSKREIDFLSRGNGPEYLVYTASPASAELALTLTRLYQEVESGPGYKLLRRRSVPLKVDRHVIVDTVVDAIDSVEIPRESQGVPAVAQVRYRRKLLSSLISALYQPPAAWLVLLDRNHAFAKIRLNALLQNEGVVLAGLPGVWDGNWLALSTSRFGLLTDEHSNATAIGFEATGPLGIGWARYFDSKVQVRVYIPEFTTQ